MSIKGENIYKRKDQRWEARYIRGHREDGSIHYGYCYGKTYREAKQKLLQARNSLQTDEQEETPCNDPEVQVLFGEWMQKCRVRVKESTYVKYQGMFERHIAPQLGRYQLSSLLPDVLNAFAHDLTYSSGLSPKTVRDILVLLHSVVRYGAEQYPAVAPAARMVYPHSERKEISVLSVGEQQRLVAYLTTDRDLYKFGVLLALMTGIRLGELCALRWKDISLENRAVRVSATMQRIQNLDPQCPAKTKIVISTPKTDQAVRLIPLTTQAYELCKEHWCADQEAFVLSGKRDVFVEPRTMQYRFSRYAADCGLDGIHFHTLRHTFATRCVEVDFEIKTLSEIMGHASPKITLERYVHASIALKRKNMEKLNAVGL